MSVLRGASYSCNNNMFNIQIFFWSAPAMPQAQTDLFHRARSLCALTVPNGTVNHCNKFSRRLGRTSGFRALPHSDTDAFAAGGASLCISLWQSIIFLIFLASSRLYSAFKPVNNTWCYYFWILHPKMSKYQIYWDPDIWRKIPFTCVQKFPLRA